MWDTSTANVYERLNKRNIWFEISNVLLWWSWLCKRKIYWEFFCSWLNCNKLRCKCNQMHFVRKRGNSFEIDVFWHRKWNFCVQLVHTYLHQHICVECKTRKHQSTKNQLKFPISTYLSFIIGTFEVHWYFFWCCLCGIGMEIRNRNQFEIFFLTRLMHFLCRVRWQQQH